MQFWKKGVTLGKNLLKTLEKFLFGCLKVMPVPPDLCAEEDIAKI